MPAKKGGLAFRMVNFVHLNRKLEYNSDMLPSQHSHG